MRTRIKGYEETFLRSEPIFSIIELLRFIHVLVQLLNGLQSFLSQTFAAALNDKTPQEGWQFSQRVDDNYDSIEDDKAQAYANNDVSKDLSHHGCAIVAKAKQQYAQSVDDDLIDYVLLVDHRLTPLVL